LGSEIKIMKLAIVSNVSGCSWGGSEEVWYRMALPALQKGHGVVACLNHDLHGAKQLVDFKKLGGRVLAWRRSKVARFENWEQKLFPNFSDLLFDNPDMILLSCGSLPAITSVPGLMSYLRKTQARFAVLCLFNAECLPLSPKERNEVAWMLENSVANIFVADQNRKLAVRQFGVGLEGAHIFYGPLRESFDDPLSMPNQSSSAVFSCVARMETLWKGQDMLLEVLATQVWRERDWKLRLYGEGPDKEHVERLINLFGLDEKVKFARFARDMKSIWQDSQVMILPSRGEGTSLAMLEAMMCGRPVVATDVGGNREVLEEGLSGWIAEATTPQSLADAMERCWGARNSWASMGARAHESAKRIADEDPSLKLLAALEEGVRS
jgi:glycosyltransferase involved in cell wall biosynthesis